MIANRDGGGSGRTSVLTVDWAGQSRPRFSADDLDHGLDRTKNWFVDQQHDEGYWVGELEGDTILESEYVLLQAFLGREKDDVCIKACKYLHKQQLPDGGWAIYPGGPMELSASVKAYFALKLVGMPTSHPSMVKAKQAILDAGGAQACNSFTRFYLAILGQIPYAECPSVPPEILFLPSHWGFCLAAMSAWTRPILVPLTILSALKPVRKLAPGLGIAELFRDDLPRTAWKWQPRICWENFFLGVDRVLKGLDRVVPRSWRKKGLQAAHRWILEHFEDSDGLGAIFPPMIYSIIALKALGYDDDSQPMLWARRHLDDLIIEEDGEVRIQPCVSPVWDTAITTIAMADAGAPSYHPAILRAVRWLLSKEVRRKGDWSARKPGVEASGWHFQFRNEFYPDIDDTAMVLLALRRSALADDPQAQEATHRGVNWLLSMQNKDGGWAAFDADIDNQILTKVPFADHNAMLDPSCADITARIVELLGGMDYRPDHPSIQRAVEYLKNTQEPEGCWYGRWGVNYIYGTWQVLLGLKAIDYPMDHPLVSRAADWLESVQQPDGGWGETCASYDDPSLKGQGPVTASQTAWAVLGLIAAGRAKSPSVERGIA
ncbi:MAG TPA: squalene--hopene cyclase, partial [Isosphaeraceae bacterium]|nr:squalene--hopene cyclase [Isosphaeraceae bacterium]